MGCREAPSVLGRTGALTFDPTNNAVSGARNQSKPAFVYGGGVDYDFSRHISLRMEYRGLVYGRPDYDLSSLHSDAIAHTAEPSLGIGIRF